MFFIAINIPCKFSENIFKQMNEILRFLCKNVTNESPGHGLQPFEGVKNVCCTCFYRLMCALIKNREACITLEPVLLLRPQLWVHVNLYEGYICVTAKGNSQ